MDFLFRRSGLQVRGGKSRGRLNNSLVKVLRPIMYISELAILRACERAAGTGASCSRQWQVPRLDESIIQEVLEFRPLSSLPYHNVFWMFI